MKSGSIPTIWVWATGWMILLSKVEKLTMEQCVFVLNYWGAGAGFNLNVWGLSNIQDRCWENIKYESRIPKKGITSGLIN